MNAGRIFATVISVILAGSTSPATLLGQNTPAAELLPADSGQDPQSLPSETEVDQSPGAGGRDLGRLPSCGCPRWTASADCIILDRVGGFNQTLIGTAPKSVSYRDLFNYPTTEVLNATDLHQGFSGGPRLDLIRHGDDDGDLEVSYFQIDGWDDCQSVGPTPNDWLVMKAPGGFVQTQFDTTSDFDTQMMAWDYTSRLYNAEVNVRWNLWPRVTVLAGFRWVNLTEELQGTLPPAGRDGALLGHPDEEQSLRSPDRRGGKAVRARPLFDWRHGEGGACSTITRRKQRSVSMTRILFRDSATTDHRRLRGRDRRAVQVSSYPAAFAQGGLRSHVAARRCSSARPDPGNVLSLAALHSLRKSTCRRWASIATPASSITGPPPAWSIRSREFTEPLAGAAGFRIRYAGVQSRRKPEDDHENATPGVPGRRRCLRCLGACRRDLVGRRGGQARGGDFGPGGPDARARRAAAHPAGLRRVPAAAAHKTGRADRRDAAGHGAGAKVRRELPREAGRRFPLSGVRKAQPAGAPGQGAQRAARGGPGPDGRDRQAVRSQGDSAVGKIGAGRGLPGVYPHVPPARRPRGHGAFSRACAMLGAKQLDELGDRFEHEEDRQFGGNGFGKGVEEVAAIERQLGIHDLEKFTPKLQKLTPNAAK